MEHREVRPLHINNALLMAVQTGQDLNVIKFLVDICHADLKAKGPFTWNGLEFEQVIPLFAAVVSDQEKTIQFFITEFIHFDLTSIISIGEREDQIQIDLLELAGAACIIYGDEYAQTHGFDCWGKAMQLRYGEDGIIVYPKLFIPLSDVGRIAVRGKEEAQSPEELHLLLERRRTDLWKIEAFLVSRRILQNHGIFPNRFIISNFHQSPQVLWDFRQLNKSYLFCYCLYLMEVFPVSWLNRQELSMIPWVVIDTMLDDYLKVLRDRVWCHHQLWKEEPTMTFERLLFSLDFVCSYLIRLHDKLSASHLIFPEEFEVMSAITSRILQLMVVAEISPEENIRLCDLLRTYFVVFYNQWNSTYPNFLTIVCSSPQANDLDYALVNILLKAGADPFLTDDDGCSPLELLAITELSMAPWESESYPVRAQNFATTIRMFLEAKCPFDFIDSNGESGLDCFREKYFDYPNRDFQSLLSSFFDLSLRPLTCIAAKVVQKHNLPVTRLPHSLQLFVKQH